MPDQFKIKVIKKLEDDIHVLTGGAFERFAYAVMPLIHDGEWRARGTTIEGAPRKGTVDTSAAAAEYVTEVSSVLGYYSGKLSKPRKDLKHVLKQHPQVKHIWLLSSRTAEASQTTKIENLAAEFRTQNASVETVDILDARQIAEYVFKHLGRRDLASLFPFLTSLAVLEEEHAFSHSIPPIDDFIPRLALEAEVLQRFNASSYLVLQGISGSGKTALAARLAHGQKPNFDNVIWHDARDLKGIQQLESVAITRSNLRHNVASLLRRERLFLVLDDPAFPLEQLAKIDCAGKSKILVTTQSDSGEHVIAVGALDPAEALGVLTNGVPVPCPIELAARIQKTVAGHALTLHALNRLARKKSGWKAVEDCLATDGVRRLEDDDKQIIFRRLLGGHSDSLSAELEFVKWCGDARFHIELADVVSSLTVDKLDERGFLAATAPGYARIHDVVYRAIQSEVIVSAASSDRFRQQLANFIRRNCDDERLILERMARVQEGIFTRLLHEYREPAFLYMVALGRAEVEAIDLLGDPVRDARALAGKGSLKEASLELRTVIEVVEALFTLRSEFRNEKAARDALKHDLEAFEILLQHPIITPEQRAMLEHHQAKMLLRVNRKDDAKGIFERLLLADPSFAAARIQLAARVLPGDKAVVECEYLLKQHRIEPEKVSLNIVLEALRVLALHDALEKHQELLTSSVKHASGVDLSMAFRLITSVGQRTWFSSPETVVPMFDAIDSRGFSPAPNDAFEWAQAHKYAAMGLNPDHPKRRSLLSDAIRLFGLAKATTSEYQRTHHAEALILTNAYEQANEQLERVPEDRRGPFWWQRRAQALAGLSRHDEAKVACDKALETLKDTTLRPAFLADRFRIRWAMGDESAVDDLDAAIDQLPAQHRFRVGLQGERAAYLEQKSRK